MKVIPIALAAHYASGSRTLAYGLKITRLDGQVFAYTSADVDVTLSGVLYSAGPGLNISQIVTSAGHAVDNLELSTLDDGTTFTALDVLSGRWTNAAFAIDRFNWAAPEDGSERLITGTLGNVTRSRGSIVAELRGLQQYLQQPIGAVTSKTCRARLGDAACGVNLTPHTYASTVTAVTNNQTFTISLTGQAVDWFTDGVLTFTSGANAGQRQKVKSYTAGAVQLSLPMLSTVAVGNAVSIVAGCRKRKVEDCAGKFANVLNFQGEAEVPGINHLTATP